jgi:putative phage-type endonuclease
MNQGEWLTCACEHHTAVQADVQAPDGGSVSAGQPRRTTSTIRVGDAEVVEVEYRSEAWYAARRTGISASEIAAVVGLSPWVSPFDLWWEKHSGEQSQGENRGMRRGRRYEALILEDFAEEHPEFHVGQSLTLRSVDRPWQFATPDAIVYEAGESVLPIAAVEAKTGQRWEWGDPGTDDIPVHYRCQVLWQMDVLGVDTVYVPALFGDQYAEYVVHRDEGDLAILRDAAVRFLDDVATGRQPDIDAHTATGRRLKKLHPSIEPGEIEIPKTLVSQYQAAKRLQKAAEERVRLAEHRIRHLLGPHAIATVDGRKVASRSVYDVAPRTQEVAGFTVNRLNVSMPKQNRKTIR